MVNVIHSALKSFLKMQLIENLFTAISRIDVFFYHSGVEEIFFKKCPRFSIYFPCFEAIDLKKIFVIRFDNDTFVILKKFGSTFIDLIVLQHFKKNTNHICFHQIFFYGK